MIRKWNTKQNQTISDRFISLNLEYSIAQVQMMINKCLYYESKNTQKKYQLFYFFYNIYVCFALYMTAVTTRRSTRQLIKWSPEKNSQETFTHTIQHVPWTLFLLDFFDNLNIRFSTKYENLSLIGEHKLDSQCPFKIYMLVKLINILHNRFVRIIPYIKH